MSHFPFNQLLTSHFIDCVFKFDLYVSEQEDDFHDIIVNEIAQTGRRHHGGLAPQKGRAHQELET